MFSREYLINALHSLREKLSKRLAMPGSQGLENTSKIRDYLTRRTTICGFVFLLALGVRVLHWQDSSAAIEQRESPLTNLAKLYEREVHRMIDSGSIFFPDQLPEPGDARMLAHPPGYSILSAAMLKASGNRQTGMILLQVICDAASAAVLFLIAAELLPLTAAFAGGTLAALSPHFSYYAVWLSPDSLAVLPILFAVYLIVKAIKRPHLLKFIAAGALIGTSCWLRSNALLLAPFLAIVILLLLARGKRLGYSAALVMALIVVISPVTIRNWVLYHRFIPLSLGAGITLIEGIADYDAQKKYDLPATDRETALKDAEWHNRPDYRGNIWSPDGIERDRYRFSRGLSVIRSNPGWFLKVMLSRAAFMLSYNGSGPANWPFNTSQVPLASATPSFGHRLAPVDEVAPMRSISPQELLASGTTLSPEAKASLTDEGEAVQIAGDGSEFADQFASAPLALTPNTDYVLKFLATLKQGSMAVKVTSKDRRITLASELLAGANDGAKKRTKQNNEAESASDSDDEQPAKTIRLAFASGERTGARIVLSNDLGQNTSPILEAGKVEIFALGETPYQWTRYPRGAIHGLQKNLFKTKIMLPLIALGIALLAFAGSGRALACLLIVPLYYLCFQSILHTEYRYILAIHYFLFAFAGIAIYITAIGFLEAGRWIISRRRRIV